MAVAFFAFGIIGWETLFTLVGGLAAFVFFVQTQRLGEVKLFKELFQEFNARYDAMNEDLNGIRDEREEGRLRKKEIAVLFNYFNLCAEEYFYYKPGYIDPDVWKAWRNGMMIFFGNKRVWDLWMSDIGTESYYGLEVELMKER